jgi:2-desacetyl-2-hydroxyethyl bacteriochlorophyllide A dehydrogenase
MPAFAAGTILGHEFVGTVIEAGPQVPFAAGQRVLASDLVACGRCPTCARGWHYHCPDASLFGYSTVVGSPIAGGQADFVRVPFADTVLSAIPDDLSDEQVLFVGDILTTAYTAADGAEISPGDVVGVVGAGPVGLLAASCAELFGAARVVVADVDRRRRMKAESMGFVAVAPEDFPAEVSRAAGGRGAPAVVEAVGSDRALECAIAAAGPRANVVVVGAHSSRAAPIATQTAFARELTLRFAVGDPIRSRDQVVALVRAGRLDPTTVISHRIPLSDAVHGYRMFDQREAFKVVLVPQE